MAKKATYVYQLKHKYKKHPEELYNYGFNFFTDDGEEVKIFACPIILAQDNPLFIQCVRFLEHCYEQAGIYILFYQHTKNYKRKRRIFSRI